MKMMTVSCRTAEYSVITIRVQTVMRKCKSIVMLRGILRNLLMLIRSHTYTKHFFLWIFNLWSSVYIHTH